MTRALPFTQAAIKRAVEGVKSGGERVTAVEIRPDGSLRVLTVDPPESAPYPAKEGPNEWDVVLRPQ